MAAPKELKANARLNAGKGAARAERRAGRVPGIVYGENQPSSSISVDPTEWHRSHTTRAPARWAAAVMAWASAR